MLEIIASTLEDAKLIKEAGGGRIELVAAFSEGGLTPSYALIKAVISSVDIPVNVMIRPHSHHYAYSEDEINIMIEDIKISKSLGANGVVLGVLTEDNKVDVAKLELLLKACEGMEVTFHRAIDECDDILEAVKKLSKYHEITRVLSSGGLGKAEDNLDMLKEMNRHIKVLPGSGININNYKMIREHIGACEIHVGSSIRKENSCLRGIDKDKLIKLVEEEGANK